ncbi:MAG: glycosyltransferase family 39 protein [bacterium]|nr:glycosyltransferase family 39 protein [bacterium]
MGKKLKTWVLNHKIEAIVLLSILLLGAFLRLYRIADYMTFLGDEGRDVLVVKRMIVDHKFTLLGPTASVGGFFLGPIYYYFMLPFLWIFKLNPVGPAVMVALFGIATIFLVYKLGKDFFGTGAGIIAAVLYAISPVVITYSHSSWNPNLVPFFSILTLFTFYKAVTKKSNIFFVLGGIFFGINLQLHYLASFLGVMMVVYLVLMEARKLKLFLGHAFLSGIGFIIGFSPFLAFELRHGFPNIQTIFRFIFSSSSGETGFVGEKFFTVVDGLVFRLFWRLLTRFPSLSEINVSEVGILGFWYWLIVILIFASLGVFFFWGFNNLKKQAVFYKFSLLAIWLIVGIGLFSFYKKPIYDYYLGFMFPLPFLLVGNFLAKLISSIKPLKIAGVVIFTLLLWNSLEGASFRFPPNRQLNQAREISRVVFEKAEGKPFNFALITGQNSDHAYRYFLEIWGTKPVTIENTQVDPERKTVTDQLLIICESMPCQPLGHSLWEIAGFGRADIAEQWDVSVVKVYKLVHYKGPT